MRLFAHDVFTYPLPTGHRFPLGKYRLVREGAEAARLDVASARAATRGELLVVTLWEEGEDPAVPRRFTDALKRRR